MPHEISLSVCDPVAPTTLDTMFFLIYYAITELLHHNWGTVAFKAQAQELTLLQSTHIYA